MFSGLRYNSLVPSVWLGDFGLLGGYFQSDVSLANRNSNCTVMVLSGASRAIWPENLERHSVTMLESAYPDTALTCAFVM